MVSTSTLTAPEGDGGCSEGVFEGSRCQGGRQEARAHRGSENPPRTLGIEFVVSAAEISIIISQCKK